MAKPKIYKGRHLDRISYPLGGIGAGMFCLDGTGMYRAFSLRGLPNLMNNPNIFAAMTLKNGSEKVSRVLEGQVPFNKVFGQIIPGHDFAPANGMSSTNFGLPRFRDAQFSARFPFPRIALTEDDLPVSVNIEGFSPFIPGDPDASGYPAAGVKYTFKNKTDREIPMAFYFASMNFMGVPGGESELYVKPIKNGFMFTQKALKDRKFARGDFAVSLDKPDTHTNTDFFRGGWWDPFTMLWNEIQDMQTPDRNAEDNRSRGGSLSHSFTLEPEGVYSVTVRFAWYVPDTDMRYGPELTEEEKTFYRPYYADKYKSAEQVMKSFSFHYNSLYRETKRFSNALYAMNLPDETVDAIASNLCILKSPTVLRQTDGRMWCWEGCVDTWGSCIGSCEHVWNYAQAICHLFPSLERTLRETEYFVSQDERGHQNFRSSLPIRPTDHVFHAASDGQPGGLMKLYRDWRISGDDEWVLSFWDKAVASMEYCIRTWDPREKGVFEEPHHNTYDIEFWGPDGMCSSFYLGALKAITEIGKHFGKDVARYETLYAKGKEYLETKLFNGEYFVQTPEWKTLNAKFDPSNEYYLVKDLLTNEGPKYQYGDGCLIDGVLGAWMAKICGLGDILDPEKVKSHLLSVYKYNFRENLYAHSNPQRPGYALGSDSGVLLCTWPHGNKPSIPFVYSDEVWTGCEYQFASHLALYGYTAEAEEVIASVRSRYDGEKRNPFDEYECGHWYARALASYSLIEAFSGVSYDAVSRTLKANAGSYVSLLCTDSGYGLVTVDGTEVSLEVLRGEIPVEQTTVNNI